MLDDGVPLVALQVNLATTEGARGLQASALGVGRGQIVPSLQACHCSDSRPHTPALHASRATYLERVVFTNPERYRRCGGISSLPEIAYLLQEPEHFLALLVLRVLLQATRHVVVGVLVLSQRVIDLPAEEDGVD
jgi:hypothetical protein